MLLQSWRLQEKLCAHDPTDGQVVKESLPEVDKKRQTWAATARKEKDSAGGSPGASTKLGMPHKTSAKRAEFTPECPAEARVWALEACGKRGQESPA